MGALVVVPQLQPFSVFPARFRLAPGSGVRPRTGSLALASPVNWRSRSDLLMTGSLPARLDGAALALSQATRQVGTLRRQLADHELLSRRSHVVLQQQQVRNEELSLMLQHAETERKSARADVSQMRASLLHAENQRDAANERALFVLGERDAVRAVLAIRVQELRWSQDGWRAADAANVYLRSGIAGLRQELERELPRLRGLLRELEQDSVSRVRYEAALAECDALRRELGLPDAVGPPPAYVVPGSVSGGSNSGGGVLGVGVGAV
ncbi:hypothetical protein BD626DRAFT_574665 [Schizophyllum amplum]|uniref:Uncharacterized protein n=1 Tax=Schizophyllum amplum TaxID=97359 RepID=A0A550BXT2_9AGAR|nr:hypothetical protein BD626DRAFT_574665 [Auriculariopsis ampla]